MDNQEQTGTAHGTGRSARLRVGLLTDPGAAADLAADLALDLPAVLAIEVHDDTEWDVTTEVHQIPLDENGLVPMESLAREHRDRQWDVMIVLTDLPRRVGTRPIATLAISRVNSGLVSLPGLGAVLVRRRAQRAVVHLVQTLTGHEPHAEPGTTRPPHTAWFSPLRRVHDDDNHTHLALVGLRGRLRLLAGMVRDNRPWRLVPHLSSATAAAAATGAYAIITTSFWTMSASLSPLRLLLINLVAILAMATWLIAYNHLWDRPEDTDARVKAVLYNAATAITIIIGVACMYMLLYIAGLLAALTLIDPGYFAAVLHRSASFPDYLKLVWLGSSVGIVAGALGSSLESEQAVRNATYGRRERERRRSRVNARA